MAKFDCIADFEALKGAEALSPAETKLIEACRQGVTCVIDEDRPNTSTPKNTVRAKLLSVLITGGTLECGLSEKGVWLVGAWINGAVDISFKKASGPTSITKCTFTDELLMVQSRLSLLILTESKFPGLYGMFMEVDSVLSLREAHSTGSIHLIDAKISGDLNCKNATFDGGPNLINEIGPVTWNNALRASNIEIGGSIFMKKLKSFGIIDLHGAKISGQIVCDEVSFDGKGGRAFRGQNLIVSENFFWRKIDTENIIGEINLSGTHVGCLNDDMESWPRNLNIDGFTYDRIAKGNITAQDRLPWLANGSNDNGIFHPQPYTQLAKVLFAMGHDREAKKILMARENRLSSVALQNLRVKPNGGTYLIFENPLIDAQVCGAKAWFWTISLLAGHGYAPFRALVAMLALIAVTTCLAYQAWSTGAFAPNSDVIVTSNAWQGAMLKDCVPTPFPGCDLNPAQTWSKDRTQGIDWASFNALAYAVDLALPVVELGQTSAWAPSKDRGVWGETLWWASWWIELLGWLFTVLGGAAITGLIQRSRD